MPDKTILNVLLIGSGGREHAIAWRLAQSPRLGKLYIAPGNPGTALHGENVSISSINQTAMVQFARDHKIDLVVVGPEQPLAEGLADAFLSAGIPVFGPTRSAARIETSKAFSKEFMIRHSIPTARFKIASDYPTATAMLHSCEYPVVIKASGLAAGKGVIIPASLEEADAALRSILVDRQFGAAGEEVLLEEKIEGEEVSLLAFTDGRTIVPMLPAQDHKRLLDGDLGPNTGGMGAYAPAPICDQNTIDWIVKHVLKPTVKGLANEGSPFCGVLYAGIMMTPQGPRVLEFNCRFGDPETQALLPLLDSDLLDICMACATQRLSRDMVRWKKAHAACVVVASGGYPEQPTLGFTISGLDETALMEDAVVFHAGTRRINDQIENTGGRVLGVTAWAGTLQEALDRAYAVIDRIQFEGMQYRKDIGQRALLVLANQKISNESAYARSGVSIDAGNKAVTLMSDAVKSTYSPRVLAGIGAFGGLFSISNLKTWDKPVLVASTDGVGTKIKLAAEIGSYRSIGKDIVNHCIDDILVQGARPLFFLDYYATAKLVPEHVAEVVTGIAEACREANCALLGGETAEMPGVYETKEFDVAGTIVGAVEQDKILPRLDLSAGDVIIGLPSTGPHTNGYSLIRQILADVDKSVYRDDLGSSLYDALLRPHRSYFPVLWPLLDRPDSPIKALAHITGGGFIENIPRVLPVYLNAQIDTSSWPVPPLFQFLQKQGTVEAREMYRVFNMGVGMLVIVAAKDAESVLAELEKPAWIIGKLVSGSKKVILQ